MVDPATLPQTTLAIKPQTWMRDMAALADRPLKDIVIPGSHDAGTFQMENRIDNNSSQCQEVDIYSQLAAGSRYLDLRAWKASDGEYWMYHGAAWTHVKLADVLSDILRFLADNTDEIVIATLLIDEKTGIDVGWQWAVTQVASQLVTLEHLQRFADATPRQLRSLGKRLVMLRHSSPEQFANMDREGVYGDSLYPSTYLNALEAYVAWSDKMWILHLGIPYKGDIHNTMPTRSKWNADDFIPHFLGTTQPDLRYRPLNIINVDFINRFGWFEAIVALNAHTPKDGSHEMTPQTAVRSLTWSLHAFEKNGHLWLSWETTSPFRAQQGKIQVYEAGVDFPADPEGHVRVECWDNDTNPWDSGLPWAPGICVGWAAEKSSNGPHVTLLKLITQGRSSRADVTYSWTLRAGDYRGKLYLEGVTDAPFRAQQGKLYAFEHDAQYPGSSRSVEATQWDDQAHPWNTGLSFKAGRRVAYEAQVSPNGAYTEFLSMNLR